MQDASVSDMIRLMAGKEVRALLALEAGKLVGIVLEGDQVRKVILTGRSFKETQVREIIAQNVIYTSPEQIDEKCLALTKEKHIRHLPVMADGHLVGIISMGDLARTIVSDQEY
jgi:IMP dehydrogenase